ncbi:unnamed protein product [Thelazia callipaeda]|uniref:WH2 domain-containing protein n=1 Tax=Thelazia callipaeda TaxID=103827 RepID=A0A0N5CSV4_THECL|nr:unnamed protein product [Thelazia callipaeda]
MSKKKVTSKSMTLGIDQIARLAAEEAKKEQGRIDGTFGLATGRRPPLTAASKERVIIFIHCKLFIYFIDSIVIL